MMLASASNVPAAPLAGFRNRLMNASFAINQIAVSGTVTLTAGQYGHDGVKAGASGATYTFATSGLDTTLTITAGSLILPIENLIIDGGTYVVSHAGSAQARVWQGTGSSGSGSYAPAPFTVTGLTAVTQTNVEFSTGTVLRPQLEPGTLATVFERRPPAIELTLACRYFQKSFPQGTAPANGVTGDRYLVAAWSGSAADSQRIPLQPMYATPTITFYSSGDGSPTNGTWQLYVAGSYVNSTPSAISLTSSGFEAEFSGLTVTSGNAYGAHGAWTAAARL